jgi:hypothetical protein
VGFSAGEVRGEVWVLAIGCEVVQTSSGVSECGASGEVVNLIHCRVELFLKEGSAV